MSQILVLFYLVCDLLENIYIYTALAAQGLRVLEKRRCYQQTRDVDPMLGKCWPIVFDVGPTLTQH